MGRRRQVSDQQISLAAREVFLDRGPKAPVAMVAKKLGVSTATLFQRTGSKQQLMLMALQPSHLAKAIVGMKQLAKNGLRYPIAPYGIQADVRAGMGVSYAKK
jgi:AcrR family transcriptional regulator